MQFQTPMCTHTPSESPEFEVQTAPRRRYGALALRLLLWMGVLTLAVASLGWFSQKKPDTPLDFSLRPVRSR